eukprot:TRINITY_DN208_c0_g1_i6.p1 TRINITY_DN208_c0_g1~~TRINITY_DN208_c0_g1_i6.p1  ORF type:complete len:211 (+),score=98.55 TRINITY_DN208_c0_g1_i6:25-633(+)
MEQEDNTGISTDPSSSMEQEDTAGISTDPSSSSSSSSSSSMEQEDTAGISTDPSSSSSSSSSSSMEQEDTAGISTDPSSSSSSSSSTAPASFVSAATMLASKPRVPTQKEIGDCLCHASTITNIGTSLSHYLPRGSSQSKDVPKDERGSNQIRLNTLLTIHNNRIVLNGSSTANKNLGNDKMKQGTLETDFLDSVGHFSIMV